MEHLAADPRVIFMGQAVIDKGTAMSETLAGVSDDRKIELPVVEEMQLGMATGMSLNGWIPVTVYPRWNFLLLAMNQLVNHLDKLAQMSNDGYQPKVIIRTSIGSMRPIDPQCQHTGDFTEAINAMLTRVQVIRLDKAEQIVPAYDYALYRTSRSTLLVEWGDYYNEL